MVDSKIKFQVDHLAPHTGDIAVLQRITKHANTGMIAMSPKDDALYLPGVSHIDAEDIAAGFKTSNSNVVVFKTQQPSHFLGAYLNALRDGPKEQLHP